MRPVARRCRQCWQKIIQCTMPVPGCIGRGWVHADTRKHSCLPWAPLNEDGSVLAAGYPMPDARFDLPAGGA